MKQANPSMKLPPKRSTASGVSELCLPQQEPSSDTEVALLTKTTPDRLTSLLRLPKNHKSRQRISGGFCFFPKSTLSQSIRTCASTFNVTDVSPASNTGAALIAAPSTAIILLARSIRGAT